LGNFFGYTGGHENIATAKNKDFVGSKDGVTILIKNDKERGRNNFLNYASQLQTAFARSQITKASK
jgi:hypothetical protein